MNSEFNHITQKKKKIHMYNPDDILFLKCRTATNNGFSIFDSLQSFVSATALPFILFLFIILSLNLFASFISHGAFIKSTVCVNRTRIVVLRFSRAAIFWLHLIVKCKESGISVWFEPLMRERTLKRFIFIFRST